jgi:hypothetical protein
LLLLLPLGLSFLLFLPLSPSLQKSSLKTFYRMRSVQHAYIPPSTCPTKHNILSMFLEFAIKHKNRRMHAF